MRLGASVIAATALCGALACLVASAAAAETPLPLKRVVLSSAGVGYFEHEARVSGDQDLPLTVRLDQVDDVLKSIVVLDDGGGVAEITLPSREAAGQAFRDLPFDEAALASPATLLGALRGAEIRLSGQRQIAGKVIAVTPETTVLPRDGGQIERHRLSVMTANGIEQAILEDADRIELADAKLQAELGSALATLLEQRSQDLRTLRLRLAGTGERRVRVGYVVETPLWKTAYRLVLPAERDAGTARLQGWAVLENVTGQDWRDVELTLASGNPVTFRQALYTAYRVKRPEVPVEVAGRVLPPADGGVVSLAARDLAAPRGEAEPQRRYKARGVPEAASLMPPAPSAAQMPGGNAAAKPLDLATATAAESEDAATQVVFTLPTPVSAARGTSLVVPILDTEAPAARLALYQPWVDADNPLAALRLKNEGETGLPPGVLALYESGARGLVFVGDARLAPLPAGEERLLAYAVDQKIEIARDTRSAEVRATGRIVDGVLTLDIVDRATTVYRVKAPVGEARRLVIEHPREADGRLVAPAGGTIEETRTHYRIARDLAAGEAAAIEVAVERPRRTIVELLTLDTKTVGFYAQRTDLDEKLREAFRRLGELRGESEAAETRRARLERERGDIVAEQGRLRANLASVPAASDLHKRYLETLKRQEDQLERLDGEIRAARERAQQTKDAVAAFVANLNV